MTVLAPHTIRALLKAKKIKRTKHHKYKAIPNKDVGGSTPATTNTAPDSASNTFMALM